MGNTEQQIEGYTDVKIGVYKGRCYFEFDVILLFVSLVHLVQRKTKDNLCIFTTQYTHNRTLALLFKY